MARLPAEVVEVIGSPGWARTSDFLINSRGLVTSRRPRRPRRLHSGAQHAVATPPMFMVFDLLHRAAAS